MVGDYHPTVAVCTIMCPLIADVYSVLMLLVRPVGLQCVHKQDQYTNHKRLAIVQRHRVLTAAMAREVRTHRIWVMPLQIHRQLQVKRQKCFIFGL